MDKPKFRHDCKECIHLGEFQGQDLYVCYQDCLGPTVIARHGNKPWEYQSGICFADTIPALGEARKRAVDLGLLDAKM